MHERNAEWITARVKEKVLRPAMMYSLETFTLTKRQKVELEVFRFSLEVTSTNKIRKEYRRDKVREARLRWFEHVQKRNTGY